MKYHNPVLKGFYPDPSVCYSAEHDKYFMVCSSFQYFPGVPLFESDDLVNWQQIGYVLTRPSQVALRDVPQSGGVFAPTIRCHNGTFYMVTTNDTTHKNFYVSTRDIYGIFDDWSDPVEVEQDGIDPSLYFEGERCYFMSNGTDDNGVGGVVQCEIDIVTGKKLTPSKCIWQGSGGRFLESPHLYKIDGKYILTAAEGGTEYGHMITCARGDTVFGPFTSCPYNPVLTNRNKAPYIIQGIGHGDLIQDRQGNWYVLSLGFRQQGIWMPFHHLGREVFLTPAFFRGGWLFCGKDGTTDYEYEIPGDFEQCEKRLWTFENTDFSVDWSSMRCPAEGSVKYSDGVLTLTGTSDTLDEESSPTFTALRQRDFCGEMSVTMTAPKSGYGGITAYITSAEHYDVILRRNEGGCEAALILNIGGIHHEQAVCPTHGDTAVIGMTFDNYGYHFTINGTVIGYGSSKYLSTEVAGGFTGVMLGIFAVDGVCEFRDFSLEYRDSEQ